MSYNQPTLRRVHVMHWNAQGITNRSTVAQLKHFIHDKKIDVLFINETFLNHQHKFKLENFKIYRNDRSDHGGGVLIAVKSSIPHKVLSPMPTKKMENISIELAISGRPIKFTSAYSAKYTPDFVNTLFLVTLMLSIPVGIVIATTLPETVYSTTSCMRIIIFMLQMILRVLAKVLHQSSLQSLIFC